jgi:hypothetical protein
MSVNGRNAVVKPELDRSGPFIGMGGLAVAAFLYGYSAIALPSMLHTVVLPVVWLLLFGLACAWFTRRPAAMVVLPVLAAVVWFAVMIGLGPDG